MDLMKIFRRKKKKEVMVKTDVAFHKPVYRQLEEIQDKVFPPDFNNIEFEDDIESYPLNLLSDESKRKIIEIIKADIKERVTNEEEKYGDIKQYINDED